MVIMSKESWDAWLKMSDYGLEINLCMQEQFPHYMDINSNDEQCMICLDVYSNLLDEYCEDISE